MAAILAQDALGQFCGAEAADKVLVDFAAGKAKVEALGAEVSERKVLTLVFPEPGAGVSISPAEGSWNLEQYMAVAVVVRNPGKKPLTLIGQLNRHPWINGFVHLPAGSKDTMIIHMRRAELTDRRKDQFVGMRGIPGGHQWHWDPFDVQAVKILTLRDLDGVSVGRSAEVVSIRAVGRYAPIPPDKEKDYFPFVDEFGQFMHADWPGKVKTAEDIRRFAARESTDLQKKTLWKWTKYGGWTEGPKLEATGHFRTEKHNGRWWLVDPEGRLFWSHGVTGVRFSTETRVGDRKHHFSVIPEEFKGKRMVDFTETDLAIRFGPDWKAMASSMAHDRLRSWGMNTVANWSEPSVCNLRRTPYVVAIHYSGPGKTGLEKLLREPEEFRKALRARLAREKGKTSEDPWCIGYFIDNEIKWGNGMDPEFYYKTVGEEMRRVAPNKLYLGSRLHGHAHPHGSRPHLVAAAAKHCDVLGVNRYRFSPSDLRMLEGVDIPIIIGEYHFGALDRGLLHTGLRGVSNQRQRAYAYEHYVTQALRHPNIVGTHWFQYRDQSVTGRGDGENYQIGFVDVCDTPYPEIIEASRRIGRNMYRIRSGN